MTSTTVSEGTGLLWGWIQLKGTSAQTQSNASDHLVWDSRGILHCKTEQQVDASVQTQQRRLCFIEALAPDVLPVVLSNVPNSV
jgi:hypothetical protein